MRYQMRSYDQLKNHQKAALFNKQKGLFIKKNQNWEISISLKNLYVLLSNYIAEGLEDIHSYN